MIRGKFVSSMDEGARAALEMRALAFEDRWAARDAHDDMAIYALALDDEGRPAGSGRMYIDDDHFVLDGVGVPAPLRGQGLGDLIMRMLLYRALEMNAPAVYARAPESAVRFCARYGLRPAGERDGVWTLCAAADEVNLQGSCHRCDGCQDDCADCQRG